MPGWGSFLFLKTSGKFACFSGKKWGLGNSSKGRERKESNACKWYCFDMIEKKNTPLLPANISIMFLQPVYCQDKRNVQGNKQMQLQELSVAISSQPQRRWTSHLWGLPLLNSVSLGFSSDCVSNSNGQSVASLIQLAINPEFKGAENWISKPCDNAKTKTQLHCVKYYSSLE